MIWPKHVSWCSNDIPESQHLNIGTGEDVTIAELAHLIAEIVGYPGKLIFDTSRPDGTPRKLLDVSKLHALGWSARTPLRTGLERAYADFTMAGNNAG